jgi:pimeloyl-ACP methyl ester carboxylesterase
MSKTSLFRRVLAPKRILAVVGALLGAVVLTAAAFERIARIQAHRKLPVPGLLVDIGGRRLHLDCRGAGSPTVVFEAGLGLLGSLSWAAVHDSIAQTTRACAYSRAGILWSDPSPAPFTSTQVARDLHSLLAKAEEAGPFVLVAHSIGGPYVLQFARLHRSDVAGLVLVDASHPDQIAPLEKATGRPMTPPTDVVAFGSWIAWTGVPRLMTRDIAPAGASAFVREASAAYAATSLKSLLRETAAVRMSLAEAGHARELGAIPLIVLAAASEMSAAELQLQQMTPDQGKAFRVVWQQLQQDASTWSSRGRLIVVSDATHFIQFDKPDLVIASVREVVADARKPAAP